MPLQKDLREFVELLNSNEVDYLVVGAFAVAYYGFPRYTADLDLLLRPTPDNAERSARWLNLDLECWESGPKISPLSPA
jgi:hypothetical protein